MHFLIKYWGFLRFAIGCLILAMDFMCPSMVFLRFSMGVVKFAMDFLRFSTDILNYYNYFGFWYLLVQAVQGLTDGLLWCFLTVQSGFSTILRVL